MFTVEYYGVNTPFLSSAPHMHCKSTETSFEKHLCLYFVDSICSREMEREHCHEKLGEKLSILLVVASNKVIVFQRASFFYLGSRSFCFIGYGCGTESCPRLKLMLLLNR